MEMLSERFIEGLHDRVRELESRFLELKESFIDLEARVDYLEKVNPEAVPLGPHTEGEGAGRRTDTDPLL
jgi:hypothetical protein